MPPEMRSGPSNFMYIRKSYVKEKSRHKKITGIFQTVVEVKPGSSYMDAIQSVAEVKQRPRVQAWIE